MSARLKSSRLQFFAMPPEIYDWLYAARQGMGLWAVCIRFQKERPTLVRPEQAIDRGARWDRICLFSGPLDSDFKTPLHNDIDPAASGWVVLDIGSEDADALEMSELVYKSNRSTAERVFRTLRAAFTKHLVAGAQARGPSGKERHYRDVWMSRMAAEQCVSGKILRQRGVLRVTFEAAPKHV